MVFSKIDLIEKINNNTREKIGMREREREREAEALLFSLLSKWPLCGFLYNVAPKGANMHRIGALIIITYKYIIVYLLHVIY